jgi:hypothetical protein
MTRDLGQVIPLGSQRELRIELAGAGGNRGSPRHPGSPRRQVLERPLAVLDGSQSFGVQRAAKKRPMRCTMFPLLRLSINGGIRRHDAR